MHETGMVRNLIRRLEQAAIEAGAERISIVSVRLGALSQMSPSHFRDHFCEAIHVLSDKHGGLFVDGGAFYCHF